MKKIPKIIFCTSIVLMLFLVVLPFFNTFITLEFTDGNAETIYDCFRLLILPIVILRIFLLSNKTKNTKNAFGAKFFIISAASLYTFFMAIIIFFGGMCNWSESKVLFVNTKNKTNKIVLREYGCGAYDSGIPTYKVFKIINANSHLNIATIIDTTKINKTLWISIEHKE